MTIGDRTPEQLFRNYCSGVDDLKDVLQTFRDLCESLGLDHWDYRNIYRSLKKRFTHEEVRGLWKVLDKRGEQKVYKKSKICRNTRVLIIGAGPCGLRMAIEAALLGARVVVMELRDTFSRNNVLHLWPFVIQDLKNIGTKVFHPRFGTGSLEHISIWRLQSVLTKIALVLGVQIHTGIQYHGLIEPGPGPDGTEKGWRASISPADHCLADYEFDVIIGANGKSVTLEGFTRKTFRGRPAIAITANFVNRRTPAEIKVKELGGVFYIFNRDYFDGLKEMFNIDLENAVYFKDDTHYFVMTAKKKCLLEKGVLKKDIPGNDMKALLARDNIDQEKMAEFSREIANYSMDFSVPDLEFATNHHGQNDMAIFDFTAMHQMDNSCYAKERRGYSLLMGVVGDALLEPFWPTGSGCARGFLGVFDAAWMIRNWCLGIKSPLEVLAERESIYQLLSQTKPDNLSTKTELFTIDPSTRYSDGRVKLRIRPEQVRHLYDTENTNTQEPIDEHLSPSEETILEDESQPVRIRKRTCRAHSIDTEMLIQWYQDTLEPFSELFHITNFTTSWYSGLAFCGLVQRFRPILMDVTELDPADVQGNNALGFALIEAEFGVSPLLSAEAMTSQEGPDRLALLSYLSQLHERLIAEPLPEDESDSESEDEDLSYELSDIIGPLARGTLSRRPSALSLLHRVNGDYQALSDSVHPLYGTLEGEEELTWEQKHMSLKACRGIAASRINAFQPQPPPLTQNFAREKTPEENYTNVVLRQKPTQGTFVELTDARTKAQNRLSVQEMKASLEKLEQENKQPTPPRMPPRPAQECCHFCRKPLLVVERHTSHGYFFHRTCFRCFTCNCPLRVGQCSMQKDTMGTARFYCTRHGLSNALTNLSKAPPLPPRRKPLIPVRQPSKPPAPEVEEERSKPEVPPRPSRHNVPLPVPEDTSDTVNKDGYHIPKIDKDEDSDSDATIEADDADKEVSSSGSAESDTSSDSPDSGGSGHASPDVIRRGAMGRRNAERPTTLFSVSQSLRLLLGHEIQTDLDEVEEQQQQLEQDGRQVENTLRDTPDEPTPDREELMEKWLDVIRQKNELKEKESKLMLKVKLMELQDRHKKLQKLLAEFGETEDVESAVLKLDDDTESLEEEILSVVQQMRELRAYLRAQNESKA